MSITKRKLEFIKIFLQLQNENIITQLENIIKTEKKEEDDDMFTPMTMKELNRRIDLSIKDSNSGKMVNVEDLLKEIEEWS